MAGDVGPEGRAGLPGTVGRVGAKGQRGDEGEAGQEVNRNKRIFLMSCRRKNAMEEEIKEAISHH